ncbi:DUF6966 domain-containing protein [Enterobacter sp.]|uniref:DUF6966 domain-containing protein n=1 Tax=Enterobacter sp. TaxID=42895 RepID=UPI00296EBC32|nr:hypothetical protein [Enterobacter sp.]
MKSEIKRTIEKMIPLLVFGEEDNWVRFFERALLELDRDYEETVDILKRQFGGMGSFNDLVLHKNCIPLLAENDELKALKQQLFELLEAEIESRSKR